MNITRNTQIAGIPGKDARDFLRQLLRFTQGNNGLSAARLPLPRGQKTNVGVLQRLHAEGFVALNETDKTWQVTDKGLQLAGARIGNRVPHTQALDLVLDIVQRADEINSSPQMIVEVRSIHVFGSVVNPGTIDHGDIDISFTYGANTKAMQEYRALETTAENAVITQFCNEMDISRSSKNGTLDDLACIQRRWIKRELSGVSRFLSVADFTDVGMKHITGANHIVFFSYRDEAGHNYQQWCARNTDDVMQDKVRLSISNSGAHYASEAARTLWGIEERWDATRVTP